MIRCTADRAYIKCPYNTLFIDAAHKLNGKWHENTNEWSFDKRDEPKLRNILLRLFGTDGNLNAPLCTVRITLDGWDGQELNLGGRVVARRRTRDYKVELGEGVILASGDLPKTGGSVKNPRIDAKAGTTFEVRDFPEQLAQEVTIPNCQLTIRPRDAWQECSRDEAITFVKAIMKQHQIRTQELE